MIIKQDTEYQASGKRFYVNYKGEDYVCIIKPSEANMTIVYRVSDKKKLWGNDYADDDTYDGWKILKECFDFE